MLPLHDLTRCLCDYSVATHGQMPQAVIVKLTFDDAETAIVRISKRTISTVGCSQSAGDLGGADAAIVDVLEALPQGQTINGEELARRAGYSFGGWFRDRLARLVREGFIVSHGRRGYGPVG